MAVVSMTPWQLMWPVKGSRVSGQDNGILFTTYNLMRQVYHLDCRRRLTGLSNTVRGLSANTVTWIFSGWIHVGGGVRFNRTRSSKVWQRD